MQDGQQVFTNAAGIPQAAMDFKAEDGSNVDFDEKAGRVLSETDVENICRRDYGFVPTADEVAKLAGATYSETGNKDITEMADKKASDTYQTVTGKPPTETQLNVTHGSDSPESSAREIALFFPGLA
jgi:nucleoside-diphosphate kinase